MRKLGHHKLTKNFWNWSAVENFHGKKRLLFWWHEFFTSNLQSFLGESLLAVNFYRFTLKKSLEWLRKLCEKRLIRLQMHFKGMAGLLSFSERADTLRKPFKCLNRGKKGKKLHKIQFFMQMNPKSVLL